jgi:3-hydroxyisobutyrate dehydrogenase-like beta-hydroxyacid dehydrogenase
LVQLTTGSGAQARAFAERIASHGGDCLVGVIMAYPDEIGDAAMILFAGDDATWSRCSNVLGALGSGVTYVGSNVGLPATLDAALGVVGVGAVAGLVQGALLCEREGFSLATYAEWMTALMPVMTHQVEHLAATLAQNRFGDTQAALKTYAAAYASFAGDAEARGTNAEVLQFLSGLLQRGVAAGYGDEEISALIKVLRAAPAV